VLITGGIGFIGTNLALNLISGGSNVTIWDTMDEKCGANKLHLLQVEGATVFNQKQCSIEKNIEVVASSDIIFHLAGATGHVSSMEHPEHDLDCNGSATLHLLDLCRNYNPKVKIIYTSTRQIYEHSNALITEQNRIKPCDINGIHKYLSEQYLELYHQNYGIDYVILRLANVYGPRQFIKDHSQGFIGWFINRAMLGEEILLYLNGDQKRNIIYIDDVVNALVLATKLHSEHRIFNICGEEISIRKIAETLLKLTGNGRISKQEYKINHKTLLIKDILCSDQLFQTTASWHPQMGYLEGLHTTLAYFRQHEKHYLR